LEIILPLLFVYFSEYLAYVKEVIIDHN